MQNVLSKRSLLGLSPSERASSGAPAHPEDPLERRRESRELCAKGFSGPSSGRRDEERAWKAEGWNENANYGPSPLSPSPGRALMGFPTPKVEPACSYDQFRLQLRDLVSIVRHPCAGKGAHRNRTSRGGETDRMLCEHEPDAR